MPWKIEWWHTGTKCGWGITCPHHPVLAIIYNHGPYMQYPYKISHLVSISKSIYIFERPTLTDGSFSLCLLFCLYVFSISKIPFIVVFLTN